jgi:hypothetical protein
VVPGSQNFQFQKAIPGSKLVMRIEFMAPKNLGVKKIFALTFKTASTLALVREGRLPSLGPAFMNSAENYQMVLAILHPSE